MKLQIFKKQRSILEQADSKIKTVRRMVQENLDSIEPIREIMEKYQDSIYYVDFSITGSDIGVKDSKKCVLNEIEQELCRLGFKTERTKHEFSDTETSYHIRIQPMRYLKWGELE